MRVRVGMAVILYLGRSHQPAAVVVVAIRPPRAEQAAVVGAVALPVAAAPVVPAQPAKVITAGLQIKTPYLAVVAVERVQADQAQRIMEMGMAALVVLQASAAAV